MVPLSAASRENGVLASSWKAGGSTRAKEPAVRRRLERRPARFPLVGERPAGTEKGDDLTTPVFSLAAGDLGCSVRRGVEEGLMGLMMVLVSGVGVAAVVRTKLAGLTKSLVKSPPDEALERLEKAAGSTFSESISKNSAFRFPMGVPEAGEAI